MEENVNNACFSKNHRNLTLLLSSKHNMYPLENPVFSCAKKWDSVGCAASRWFFQGNRCGCSSSKRLTDDVRRRTTDSGDCISFKLYKSQVLSAIWPQTHCYSRKGITNHSSSNFPCRMCKNSFLLKLASKSERICHSGKM